jgi:hypothetical protein
MRGCSIAITETIHRPVTATSAFVELLVTGCGAPTNGLEEKSGTEVLDGATAAIDGASGVHVTGTGISGAGRQRSI